MFGTAIEVHEFPKSYGRRPAFGGLAFAVGTGEIFGNRPERRRRDVTVEILQGLRGRDAVRVAVARSAAARGSPDRGHHGRPRWAWPAGLIQRASAMNHQPFLGPRREEIDT
jgi:hypothetical protein